VSSIDDPILKELLTAFKEDSYRLAEDLLQGITTQAMIAAFALFLAIGSLVRLSNPPGPFRPRPGSEITAIIDTILTLVLFALSVFSFYNLTKARRRYSRILSLAERLGR
jgi:hypothetical protein